MLKSILIATFLIILSTSLHSQSWIWTQQMEGPDKDEILGITTDHQGNVYVCGRYQDTIRFSSTTFFAGNPNYYDGFIAKYDSSGQFQWARNFGGNHHDYASAICSDDSGYLYVACYGRSSTAITFDNFSYTGTGNDKTFLLKLNSSGNLVWGKLITAGISNAYPSSVSVKNGRVAVAGNFAFLDLIIESDTLLHWGSEDIFLAIYTTSSGNLLWTKALNSQFQDYANDVVLDDSGNVYLTGIFNSTFSLGGVDTFYTPYGYEVFLCKFNPYGQYEWARRYNGIGDHMVDALNIDNQGNIYIAGWHGSGTHMLNDTVFSMLYAYNFFLQKVSPGGNSLWTRHFHGGSLGRIIGMAIDPANHVILSGYLGSQFLFDTIPVVGSNSNYRMFLAKIDDSGNVLEAIDGGNRVNNGGFNNVAADLFGNIYTVGWFGSAAGHLCVFGNDTLTSVGESDGYLVKYGVPGGIPCLVQAGFLYPASVLCEGDSLQFTNTSLNAVNYKWLVNGTEVSLIENPVLQLPGAGYCTVTLIASDAVCYDTIEQVFYIHQKWFGDIYDTICQGDEYLFDGVFLSQAGTYYSYHSTSFGCDSVTTLYLTVDTFSVSFLTYGDSAVASPGAVSYAWLHCDQGMCMIPGEIYPFFRPDVSGNYTVMATNGRCIDTAVCQYMVVISVENVQNEVRECYVYPVPARDFLVFGALPQEISFQTEVYDLTGKLLLKSSVSAEHPVLQLSSVSPGIYMIVLRRDKEPPMQFRIVRE